MMPFDETDQISRNQRARPRHAGAMSAYRRAASLSAELNGVSLADVLSASRRKGAVAEARRLAAYLTVITFGLSRRQVARLAGRDAMEVSRACAAIEDMRDDRAFDQLVAQYEARLRG